MSAGPTRRERFIRKLATLIVRGVERHSHFVMLFPLPDGHTAEAVRTALGHAIGRLPDQRWQSLTWDQGKEMAEHATFTIDTGLRIYFCDPNALFGVNGDDLGNRASRAGPPRTGCQARPGLLQLRRSHAKHKPGLCNCRLGFWSSSGSSAEFVASAV